MVERAIVQLRFVVSQEAAEVHDLVTQVLCFGTVKQEELLPDLIVQMTEVVGEQPVRVKMVMLSSQVKSVEVRERVSEAL